MTRHVRLLAALTCAALAALAAPAPARAHGGMTRVGRPVRVVDDRPVGPYLVSVWAAPDVGSGTVHVVYAPRDGAPFVAPTAVRVGIAPVSGRLTEALYHARPESVRRGARFVAHVTFDRGEAWRVRVVTDRPAGRDELAAELTTTPVGAPGPLGILFYAAPFLLVAGLWGPAAVARRRVAGRAVALASH
jgi:hypothetical protein